MSRGQGVSQVFPRKKCGSRAGHSAHDTARRHSLEYPHHGQGAGHQPDGGSAYLGSIRPQASSSPRLSSSAATNVLSKNFYHVVGLYLNPPDKALVSCVDEKSQIQALYRTQPRPPIKKGAAGL